jgi:hypothetical protein
MKKLKNIRVLFIIGQPRSGTSLLQQILLFSGCIVSFPEPWFMLPLIYTHKFPGISSVFNSRFANACFSEFLKNIDNGHKRFLELLGEFSRKIYGMSVCSDHVEYVLDKTPRYYHVIEELTQILPDAKIIVIKRNPLSVFSSILSYNFSGNCKRMLQAPDRLHDLITAPKKIHKAEKSNYENLISIKYEDLVTNTTEVIQKLNNFFDGIFLEETYKIHGAFKNTTSIDTKSVHKHNRPVTFYLEEWKTSIDCRKKKVLLSDYLKYMNPEFWDGYGYKYESMKNELDNHSVRFSFCRHKFRDYVNNHYDAMS